MVTVDGQRGLLGTAHGGHISGGKASILISLPHSESTNPAEKGALSPAAGPLRLAAWPSMPRSLQSPSGVRNAPVYWGKRVGASQIVQRDVGALCQFLCDRSDRVRMSGESPRIGPTFQSPLGDKGSCLSARSPPCRWRFARKSVPRGVTDQPAAGERRPGRWMRLLTAVTQRSVYWIGGDGPRRGFARHRRAALRRRALAVFAPPSRRPSRPRGYPVRLFAEQCPSEVVDRLGTLGPIRARRSASRSTP